MSGTAVKLNRYFHWAFLFAAMLLCEPIFAVETLTGVDAPRPCAVSGRIYEPTYLVDGLNIELIGVDSSIRQKTRVTDGSFEFRAVPTGRYEFHVIDRAGKVILRQTEQLNGHADYVRIRLLIPSVGSSGLVSVRQLSHKRDDKALKMFRKGVEALQLNQLQNAITFFGDAVSLDPLFVDAHINMILPYLKLGQRDNAVDHARRAYEIDPAAYQTGYNLSATLIVVGRYREAETVTRSLSTSNNNFAPTQTLLALSLFGQRDRTAEAMEHLNLALKEFPAARLIAVDVLAATGQIPFAMDLTREYIRSSASPCEQIGLQAWVEQKLGLSLVGTFDRARQGGQ